MSEAAHDATTSDLDAGKKTVKRVSLLQKLIALCDRYGQTSLNDPRRQPQTLPGVLVTVVSLVIVVVLVVGTVIKVAQGKRDVRLGGRAPLNGLYLTKRNGNTTGIQTWDHFYVPSLELKFEEKLIFFHRPGDRRPI